MVKKPQLAINTATAPPPPSGITVAETGSLRGDGISVSMQGLRIADGGGLHALARTHTAAPPAPAGCTRRGAAVCRFWQPADARFVELRGRLIVAQRNGRGARVG